jgi:hypothetical protein
MKSPSDHAVQMSSELISATGATSQTLASAERAALRIELAAYCTSCEVLRAA